MMFLLRQKSISLPHTEAALGAYYTLAPAEASSNLARYDGLRFGVDASKRERLTPITTIHNLLF
eukprot:scaffold392982_cov20-Prasinocladus_malaysianus.AAC.1